ncbi:hypothetical protein BDW59DRAFT_167121 [Aspergillus cavernicola]|uniref:Uncharacterized protein n=1 Tax=Aspergillus cavernicola TaxID=176166 RepID=A0ABR4HGF6_9EURO
MSPHITVPPQPLRLASENERRYITRHALGFYNTLTTTALYTRQEDPTKNSSGFDIKNLASYTPALKFWLFKGGDNEDEDGDELEVLKKVTLGIHDQGFEDVEDVEDVPPWRVTVLPLLNSKGNDGDGVEKRAYIIFSYSHSHGDGRSGLIFHRTFLAGLQTADDQYHANHVSESTPPTFPPPLEEAFTLRITWSYLCGSSLGFRLPCGPRGGGGEVMRYDDRGIFGQGRRFFW